MTSYIHIAGCRYNNSWPPCTKVTSHVCNTIWVETWQTGKSVAYTITCRCYTHRLQRYLESLCRGDCLCQLPFQSCTTTSSLSQKTPHSTFTPRLLGFTTQHYSTSQWNIKGWIMYIYIWPYTLNLRQLLMYLQLPFACVIKRNWTDVYNWKYSPGSITTNNWWFKCSITNGLWIPLTLVCHTTVCKLLDGTRTAVFNIYTHWSIHT